MQALQLMALFAIFVLGAFLLGGRYRDLHYASPRVAEVAVGAGIGVFGALFVLVLRSDLVPDEFEGVGRPLLFVALLVLALLAAVWNYQRDG